jgi:hypothetical protein
MDHVKKKKTKQYTFLYLLLLFVYLQSAFIISLIYQILLSLSLLL